MKKFLMRCATNAFINGFYKGKARKYHVATRSFITSALNLAKMSRTQAEIKYIQENDLPLLMRKQKNISNSTYNWTKVRSELSSRHELIKPDSVILEYCLKKRDYEPAFSYIDYLKRNNLHVTLYVRGLYFRFFYISKTDGYKTVSVTADEEAKLMKLYEELRRDFKVLDVTTLEHVLCGLSVTTRWKLCHELLEEIKRSEPPSPAIYTCLAVGAFRNNQSELAWEYLNLSMDVSNGQWIPTPAIAAYLNNLKLASSRFKFLDDLEHLLVFLKIYDLHVDTVCSRALKQACHMRNIGVVNAAIDKRGVCDNCGVKLGRLELSKQQLCELKDAIWQSVIIGKDIHLRSNPQELSNFKKFIYRKVTYDVIIDGLNVAYAGSKSYSNSEQQARKVASMVHHFAEKGNKIALFGRTHMSKWNQQYWTYISNNANVFLTDCLSQDDPFLLYTALDCGNEVSIISNDLMRQHLFRLKEPQLKSTFSLWLNQNLHQFNFDREGKVYLRPKMPYIKAPQNQRHQWHLPCAPNNNVTDVGWLCIAI